MHNVDSCRFVDLGVLDEKEVALFVFKVQVIGVVTAAVDVAEICTLVPIVAVKGGVEHEARVVLGSGVEYVNAVDKGGLRISCRVSYVTGIAYLPGEAVIAAYRVAELLLVCLVVCVGVEDSLGIKEKRAIAVAACGFVFYDTALLKAPTVITAYVKAIYVLVGRAKKVLVTVYHSVYYTVFVNDVVYSALIRNAFVRLRPGHTAVGASYAHRRKPGLTAVRL